MTALLLMYVHFLTQCWVYCVVHHLQPLTKQCGRAQRGLEENSSQQQQSGIWNPSLVNEGYHPFNGVNLLADTLNIRIPFNCRCFWVQELQLHQVSEAVKGCLVTKWQNVRFSPFVFVWGCFKSWGCSLLTHLPSDSNSLSLAKEVCSFPWFTYFRVIVSWTSVNNDNAAVCTWCS